MLFAKISVVLGVFSAMLGAMSANGWEIIIGAIFLGIGQLVAMYLSYLRANKQDERLAKVADKVEVVKENVSKVEEKIEVVHKATNSMKDAIVDVTRLAGLSEGELKGRAAQKEESKLDVKLANDLKLEEKQVEKQDAKELREETKEIADKLQDVKVTGEETNKIVKKNGGQT